MNITTVGIDLAKATFSLHGVDAVGQVLLRRTIKRSQLRELIAKLRACRIGLETGSAARQ
jgi:transposase